MRRQGLALPVASRGSVHQADLQFAMTWLGLGRPARMLRTDPDRHLYRGRRATQTLGTSSALTPVVVAPLGAYGVGARGRLQCGDPGISLVRSDGSRATLQSSTLAYPPFQKGDQVSARRRLTHLMRHYMAVVAHGHTTCLTLMTRWIALVAFDLSCSVNVKHGQQLLCSPTAKHIATADSS